MTSKLGWNPTKPPSHAEKLKKIIIEREKYIQEEYYTKTLRSRKKRKRKKEKQSNILGGICS